jgi:hypothetical protein
LTYILIDLANLKIETENIRNRIDEIIKSGTKKQEEIKTMEKKIVVNEQNYKNELEKNSTMYNLKYLRKSLVII